MRRPIRTRWPVALVLSALIAALMVTPALAVAGSDVYLGAISSNASDMPAAGHVANRALASAVVRKPDGRVRLATSGAPGGAFLYTYHGPWLGNNIYNATGAHQTAVEVAMGSTMALGTYYTFGISIQNDGSASDRFRVKATGTSSAWVVTYSRGTTNITSAVVAGTYRTPSLAPGATYLISARITLPQSSNLSFSVARLVTIRSVGDPTKIDAVKFGFK